MPTLVTPELRIYHIKSVEQLNEFAKASKIDWRLRGNIAQLYGYTMGNVHGYWCARLRRMIEYS